MLLDVTILIECFHLQNERLVSGVQDMRHKIINRGVLVRFVGNVHVCQVPKSSFFIAACTIGAYQALFNKYIYFSIFWRLFM